MTAFEPALDALAGIRREFHSDEGGAARRFHFLASSGVDANHRLHVRLG